MNRDLLWKLLPRGEFLAGLLLCIISATPFVTIFYLSYTYQDIGRAGEGQMYVERLQRKRQRIRECEETLRKMSPLQKKALGKECHE